MQRIGRGIAICATVAVVGLAMTACDSDDTDSKLDSISDTVDEASKLQLDLHEAVNRLVMDCMEEQGFDVHPQWLIDVEPKGEDDVSPIDDARPPEADDVPTLKDARKSGFGNYVSFNPDQSEESAGEGEVIEKDPFDEQSDKYRGEYETAQYGEGYLNMEEDGSRPLAGGCTGEVGKKVYGDPITPDPNPEDNAVAGPQYDVRYPDGLGDRDKQVKLYETPELLGARDELAKCIEAEGYPYFEYRKGWGMGMSIYVDGFYEENENTTWLDDRPEYEPPKGAPWPFDEAFAAEVAFATMVADCADDTGFREISRKAWSAAVEKNLLAGEEGIHAWYEDIKAALEKAQDLLEN